MVFATAAADCSVAHGSDAICGTLRHTPPIQGCTPCAGNESLLNHAEKSAGSSRTVNVRSGHIDRDRCKACHGSLPSPGADLGAGIPPQMPAPPPRRSPLVDGAFFYQLSPSRRGSRTGMPAAAIAGASRSAMFVLAMPWRKFSCARRESYAVVLGLRWIGSKRALGQNTLSGVLRIVLLAMRCTTCCPARRAGDPRAARGGWLRRITASRVAPGSRPDALRRCRFPAGIRIPSAPAAAGSSGCFRCGHRSEGRTACRGRRPG